MYEEMIARAEEKIEAGTPLNGFEMSLALEMERAEGELFNEEEELARLIDSLAG